MPDNDDLPLNSQGNLYDPLFADRIERLDRNGGYPPEPPLPPGEDGGNWGRSSFVILLVVVGTIRGCAAMISSSPRSEPEWKPPPVVVDRKIDRIPKAQREPQEELKWEEVLPPDDPERARFIPREQRWQIQDDDKRRDRFRIQPDKEPGNGRGRTP